MASVIDKSKIILTLQSGTSRTFLATWSGAKTEDHLDHYAIQWWYWSGNTENGKPSGKKIWILADDTTSSIKQSTYEAPDIAQEVRVRVKPVAQENNKNKPYWKVDWSGYVYKYTSAVTLPNVPSAPTVTLTNYKLTAEVNIYDSNTKQIEFDVVKNETKDLDVSEVGIVDVKFNHAAFECRIGGGEYKVHCRAIGEKGQTSDWSEWSSTQTSLPRNYKGKPVLKAISDTEVEVNWNEVNLATGYVIEYAKKTEYFDHSPTNVQSVSVGKVTSARITGLDSGDTWWFRIQSTNSAGSSEFSDAESITIGKKPEPPTTWSLKSSVVLNDPAGATLYWVHNSADNSMATEAEISLSVNGRTPTIIPQEYTHQEGETEGAYSYTFTPSESGKITWKVRTKGVVDEFSNWSITRELKVVAPPTLGFVDTIPQTLTSYPLRVSVTAGPQDQKALRFFVSVVANDSYEATEYDGTSKWISGGEEIFSRNYYGDPDVSTGRPTNSLTVDLTPGDLTLYNGVSYTIKVLASMDSGMSSEVSATFEVGFDGTTFEPDAIIDIDMVNYSAIVTPFCLDAEDDSVLADVVLAVYRREFDGTFTLISDNIVNDYTGVLDSHPSLDYARYRIVAISNVTGEIRFTDLADYEVGEVGTIIQWNAGRSNFVKSDEDENEVIHSGELLRLPYNIDVSENYSPDTSMIEYIGREHPVSYYGTQRGSTATWNMEIDREDTKTLYALRRLAIYPGDVYVREPSGTGYWANVKVSFSQKHCEVTIPVTLSITRVEGGA